MDDHIPRRQTGEVWFDPFQEPNVLVKSVPLGGRRTLRSAFVKMAFEAKKYNDFAHYVLAIPGLDVKARYYYDTHMRAYFLDYGRSCYTFPAQWTWRRYWRPRDLTVPFWMESEGA